MNVVTSVTKLPRSCFELLLSESSRTDLDSESVERIVLKTDAGPGKMMQTTNKLLDLSPRANYTERKPLVGEVELNFADRGCHVVSMTDPYCCVFDFLDRSLYFFFRVAPQLYSGG
jgi:hypothetical protein